jgi:ornithine cyclodeaminase/alanine dehydrogenase-like protein (mu-crystallin family)
MPELGAGVEGAPPLRVEREGAIAVAVAVEEPAREALGSLGIVGRRVMKHILVELLLRHRLNHKLNVWSKTT